MNERVGDVVVVGSINIDLVVGVSRLPRAGETVLGDRFAQLPGGKGANQAVAASRAGSHVRMVGAVGDDDLGRSALDALSGAGVDISHCRVVEREHTGLALIVVDAAGENQIAVAPGANGRLDAAMLEVELAALDPPQRGVCLLSFEVGDEAVLAAARWAAQNGLLIVLNPAPARAIAAELLALRPILTPNESEAEQLSGEADPAAAAKILSSQTGASVVVTMGSAGALLWADGSPQRLAAYRVKSIDTTGAGDALNGIFAAELSRGASSRTALLWAMVGAALKTTRSGAQDGLPSRSQIAERVAGLADV